MGEAVALHVGDEEELGFGGGGGGEAAGFAEEGVGGENVGEGLVECPEEGLVVGAGDVAAEGEEPAEGGAFFLPSSPPVDLKGR